MGIIPRCPKLVWEEKTMLIKRKMKKLNLEKLKLAAEDVLQRSQLGTIYGGSEGAPTPAFLRCQQWSRAMEVSHCSDVIIEMFCGYEPGPHTCNCNN